MKKTFTKVVSSIIACVMLISMLSMNVSAAPYETTGLDPDKTAGSLTLSPNVSGKENSRYTAYQVLKAVLPADGGQDTYGYEAADSFTGIIGEGDDKISVEDIAKATGSDTYVINDSLDKIAAQLEHYVKTQSITGTEIEPNKKKDNLSIGYYLILETTITAGYKQTKPMLVAIPGKDKQGKYIYDVTVTIKDQPLETIKTVEEAEQDIKDSISQQVGKTVTFKIVQDVPKYDDTYKDIVFKVTDTMSKGLEFVDNSVEVKTKTGQDISDTPLNQGTDYSVTGPTVDNQSGKSTIVFDFSQNKTNQGTDFYAQVKGADQVIITYRATLTKDANFTVNGNLNEAYPTFGDDPTDTTDGKKDMAKVFSGGLKLTKKDADAVKTLTGAEFTVYTDVNCETEAKLVTYEVNDDGVITETVNKNLSATATVDENGVVRFDGLGAGTYYIKETKAPSGYIKLKDPIKVEVTVELPDAITTGNETATFTYKISGNGIQGEVTVDNNGIAAFDVRNTQGFTLPTTGGMGTYLFTIGGVVLIALAAVLLLVRSRKKSKWLIRRKKRRKRDIGSPIF